MNNLPNQYGKECEDGHNQSRLKYQEIELIMNQWIESNLSSRNHAKLGVMVRMRTLYLINPNRKIGTSILLRDIYCTELVTRHILGL